MEKEENVYEENTMTGQGEDGMDGGMDARQKGPTVLGKFKDVDALARAYEALQSEFTRRSQRLKELERKVENFEEKVGTEKSERSGVEKLRKNAKNRREQEKAFDEFVADVLGNPEKPLDKTEEPTLAESNAEKIVENGQGEMSVTTKQEEVKNPTGETELQEENAKIALNSVEDKTETENGKIADIRQGTEGKKGTVLPSVVEGDHEKTPSEELYRQVNADEGVRLRIIGEYLSSLKRSAVPLTAQGGGTLATPPIKPTSISGAGEMALQYLKSRKDGK